MHNKSCTFEIMPLMLIGNYPDKHGYSAIFLTDEKQMCNSKFLRHL
jgi:hypothetical protein